MKVTDEMVKAFLDALGDGPLNTIGQVDDGVRAGLEAALAVMSAEAEYVTEEPRDAGARVLCRTGSTWGRLRDDEWMHHGAGVTVSWDYVQRWAPLKRIA